MLIQKLRERMARDESGFTLVELLVVMLILGILAAIAIPSFFNQRNKATDASAKSMAKTSQTAIETYATDNGGSYAGANGDPAALEAIESTINTAAGVTPRLSDVVAAASTYTVTVTSKTGNTFSIVRAANGDLTLSCTVPAGAGDRGGCPTSGTWG
jgi:type IV pilus assembly protein PilA